MGLVVKEVIIILQLKQDLSEMALLNHQSGVANILSTSH